ncbi:hypothetical protein GGS23DRAFT_278356 [Durotheca rogersii]|uniref:uncharacterized protein n=1 Tax=Durotheca rogersii TaxID=419775 RepID=UPI00221F86D2|nr:uncharacterized protein GGS23DRAFT_278356 [Durotheca rogersii]KAI5866588.1 hypothetical protein GGS23DRAFT_278356 [Durotheca rogersii]
MGWSALLSIYTPCSTDKINSRARNNKNSSSVGDDTFNPAPTRHAYIGWRQDGACWHRHTYLLPIATYHLPSHRACNLQGTHTIPTGKRGEGKQSGRQPAIPQRRRTGEDRMTVTGGSRRGGVGRAEWSRPTHIRAIPSRHPSQRDQQPLHTREVGQRRYHRFGT